MNDFYEEPRQLNIKKIIIIVTILILILLIITLLIARKISKPKTNSDSANTTTSTIFYTLDNSAYLELPNSFNLKQYTSDYLLELRSENNLNIFIEKANVFQNKNLKEVIEADKITFLKNFAGHSNLSESKELSINNNLAYTYSFHYLDKNIGKAFYLQVTWLQINDNYYIFNIEFPLDDLAFNTNISSSVLSNFKVTEQIRTLSIRINKNILKTNYIK